MFIPKVEAETQERGSTAIKENRPGKRNYQKKLVITLDRVFHPFDGQTLV
jgi:hypothetical protein